MTISLNDTLDEVRRQFRDVAWSNTTLKAWIKDAVRDYSNSFPATGSVSDDSATGTYVYDFFAGAHAEEDLPVILGIYEFEYPDDEDPPEYPRRLSHSDDAFFDSGESLYDLVLNPSMNNGEIWLSSPLTTDAFTVKYFTEHVWTSVDAGADENSEVPSHHRPVIVQYVIWQCYREMMTVTRSDDDIKALEALGKRADLESERYYKMLDRYKEQHFSESGIIKWKMDDHDKVY